MSKVRELEGELGSESEKRRIIEGELYRELNKPKSSIGCQAQLFNEDGMRAESNDLKHQLENEKTHANLQASRNQQHMHQLLEDLKDRDNKVFDQNQEINKLHLDINHLNMQINDLQL